MSFATFKKTWQEWNHDGAPQLSAALSYYAIFSLAPLLLLLIFLLGLFLRDAVVQEQIFSFLQSNIGPESAQTVHSMMEAVSKQSESAFTKILSFVFLALGATGVVNQIQVAFNKIWKVDLKKGFKKTLKRKLFSFLLISIVGVLIFLSLILSTALSLAFKYLRDIIPQISYILPFFELIVTFGLTSLLFMIMFRYIPETEVRWKDVWRGGFLTGFLFLIGKFALTWYFSMANVSSGYGAAGSLLVILLWVYFSSMILLFGAEYTQLTTAKSFLKRLFKKR